MCCPTDRAEVYDQAVDTLLRERHRHSLGSNATQGEAGKDVTIERNRLALVAFHLHLSGRAKKALLKTI